MTGGTAARSPTLADEAIVVPSDRTSRIQEAHLFVGHLLCAQVELDELAAGA